MLPDVVLPMAANVDRSRVADLSRLIYALGIRHVGERSGQVLAAAFGSMDALLAAPVERLQETREIGPVLAASVRAWLDGRQVCPDSVAVVLPRLGPTS